MRGEDRGREWERWFDGGSPPHARGRQLRDRRQNRLRRITPACAGKTQAGRKSRSARRDHPRMRGEDYAQMKKGVESPGSPPHARGRRPRAQHRSYVLRITPACAGETRPLAERFSRNTDHPRMRGEDFNAFSLPTLAAGSPPHARGRPPNRPRSRTPGRITPACAGKTGVRISVNYYGRDHPRMRGEDS